MRRILIVVLIAAAASTALAWSEAGHKIVGSIAFRQLTPEQQAKIVAILKNHPRWQQDFESKMPADLTTDAEKNEWVFQQAATWPDMARSLQGDDRKYHHPTWHYIDIPTFLTPSDKAALDGTLKDNVSTDLPTKEFDTLNAIQAIKLARKVVVDPLTPDDQKAVLLCWIFHDVGDIHQPLHSTALYSKNLFPTGDRGGNSIKTDQRQNLHAVWDQFLGLRANFRTARNRAIELVNDPEQNKAGTKAAQVLDEEVWLAESHALAESTAYDSEITGYLRGYIEQTQAPPIHLTERYLQTGGAVAKRRVVEAGYRLAGILTNILSAPQ